MIKKFQLYPRGQKLRGTMIQKTQAGSLIYLIFMDEKIKRQQNMF